MIKAFAAVAAMMVMAALQQHQASSGRRSDNDRVRPDRSAISARTSAIGCIFDTDMSTIREDGRQTLNRQAEWLKKYTNYPITIEGHCDERGTREYNLALGERRANAARQYLIAQGVPASRIKTISYGKERPDPVGSDEGRLGAQPPRRDRAAVGLLQQIRNATTPVARDRRFRLLAGRSCLKMAAFARETMPP